MDYKNTTAYKKFMKACNDAEISTKKADDALRRAYIKYRDDRYKHGSSTKDILIFAAIVLAGHQIGLPANIIMGIVGAKIFHDITIDTDNWANKGKQFKNEEGEISMGTGIYTTHLYDNINQAINEALDEDSFFGKIGKSMPIDEWVNLNKNLQNLVNLKQKKN